MKAEGLFFKMVAESLKKYHTNYYKNGGKKNFTTNLQYVVRLIYRVGSR